MNLPLDPLISPLAKGGFALEFAGGAGWSSRYVAGPENGILVRAIAEFCSVPACPYSPLVLFGPSGTGKSHLARGIAEHLAPALHVMLAGGADFAREYAGAVHMRSVPAWREPYRTADLLVLDDLDPLVDKPAAQIELLHTLDELHAGGGRAVVTAKLAPCRLPRLLPALASRLSGGLSIGVAAPGPVARLAGMRLIAAHRNLTLDSDAARLLADSLAVNLAEFSGVLHELSAAGIEDRPGGSAAPEETRGAGARIDLGMVVQYLKGRTVGRRPTLRDVAIRTARHFSLPVTELRGPSRRQHISRARAVAMYLAHQLTGKSLGTVGKYFGGRDHTTVLHGCRKIVGLMAGDAVVRQSVMELRGMLEGCA